jgi:hypothetical protein
VRPNRASVVSVVIVTLALPLGGCDVGEKDEPPPAPVEKADPLPKLPDRWSRHSNPKLGFAIGVPPQWSASDRRRSSLFRSPNRLVAVSVSADRSEGGLAVPIDEFADRVTKALPDLRGLKAKRPRPFRARYDAVAVTATAKSKKGGVPQRLLVVVERREPFATYTVVVAANAKQGSGAHRDEVLRMVRSLRGRPARPGR